MPNTASKGYANWKRKQSSAVQSTLESKRNMVVICGSLKSNWEKLNFLSSCNYSPNHGGFLTTESAWKAIQSEYPEIKNQKLFTKTPEKALADRQKWLASKEVKS